ncbi:MAG: adenylate kinase [Candidatus Omnitrophica bacterium]|nr:adenylate kinase [Candidatus Omnitrophota bacterium]
MKIILLGPPGAGKGTQAVNLAQKLKLAHISTGDLLRQNVSGGTDLGKQAKSYMEKGALVPDDLVTQMLQRRIQAQDVKKGFILDGYPRNIAQAKALDAMLKQENAAIDFAVYLEASEPVIIQRLTGRLVCKNCGANFHRKNMPPRVEMMCDKCGGTLYQRTDDNEATIKTRLEVYRKEVSALLQYYEAKRQLHRLNADEDADAVLNEIIRLAAKA